MIRRLNQTGPQPSWRTPPLMKKSSMLVLRIVFALAGLGYIAYALQWSDQLEAGGRVRPGIVTMLREADVTLIIIGFTLFLPIYPIQTLRWWLLMRARGMQVPMWRAFRLTMVGCFFNYCMPGTTGGDVVKAYYAAKNSSRRADAVMSVIFDRITGLLGLVLLAGIAGLFMLHHPVARHVTFYIWLSAAIIVTLSAFYFSRHLRLGSGLDRLLRNIPPNSLPGKIDQAAVAYRDHKLDVTAAIFMSVPVHLLASTGMAMAGFAIGIEEPLGLLLTVLPVLALAGSVPLTYQGLGVMEGLGAVLLVDSHFNHIVGMLMLARFYQVAYSLTGSLFLLRGDIHLHPAVELPETSGP